MKFVTLFFQKNDERVFFMHTGNCQYGSLTKNVVLKMETDDKVQVVGDGRAINYYSTENRNILTGPLIALN